MPHISIEYTRNLAERLDIEHIVNSLHSSAQSLNVFPHWGIRTFAHEVEYARVADDVIDGLTGYVQVRVKVAAGRSTSTVCRIVDELYEALEMSLEPTTSKQPVGFQLEILQFDPQTTRSGGSIPGAPERLK